MIAMRRIGLMVLLAASTFLPGVADARGWPRGGIVRTPYGSANMNSPEWKQSGGDFRVYQQIMQQKQMMLQQRAMMKQQASLPQTAEEGRSRPAFEYRRRPPRGGLEDEEETSHPEGRSGIGPCPKAQTPSKTTKP